MTLVDTSVWSLALRRRHNGSSPLVGVLHELIATGQVIIIGPIRQELLTGIRSIADYEQLCVYLAAFPDIPLITSDYEEAARFANLCRANGVQGSPTDFVICAAAVRIGANILTADKNFVRFSEHIPIKLYDGH